MRVTLTADVAAFGARGDTVDVSPLEAQALFAAGQAEQAAEKQSGKRKRARGSQTAETAESTEASEGDAGVEER